VRHQRRPRGAIRRGTFREDFFYRINVVAVRLKPLRERREDIVPLADSFLDEFVPRFGKHLAGFSTEARRVMSSYGWPGNIRELRNAIERAALLETAGEIQAASLPIGADVTRLRRPAPRKRRRFWASLPEDYAQASTPSSASS